MPEILLKPRVHTDKHKLKFKQEPNKNESILLPSLQAFKRELL